MENVQSILSNTVFTSVVVPFVVAVVGVILGGRIANGHTLRLERFRFLAELHREIASAEMIRCRTLCQDIMADYRNYTLKQMFDSEQLHDQLNPVWVLIGFYERLHLAMQKDLVEQRDATTTFAPLFLFFNIGFFSKQLSGSGWGYYEKQMDELQALFNSSTDAKQWNEWVRQAELDGSAVLASRPIRALAA